MRLNAQTPTGTGFTTLVSFVIIAGVLYFGKEVLIPLALASLLSFLLAPLVIRFGRWGLGKIPSILLAVTLASGLVAVIGWLVMAQLIHLADQLPKYQHNLHAKVLALRRPNGDGVLSRTVGMWHRLQKEVESLTPSEDETANSPAEGEKPFPVEVRRPRPTPFEVIGNVVGPVLKPAGTAAAVVFFVILMLFQREDLRERFLKLVSGGELSVATQAVDDAAQRVSRYLLMQLIVNATYGMPIGIGLYFIGVPNAFLWGLLATLLRFIPFLGPWIAASFPLILAFAVDPGWTKVILTVVLFLVVEVASNNVIEPWLYGASTGVSNIALLVAAIFWTWLWGTVGLLLSTPMTVCLLVLGKYVPGLSFLSVLLGSEPVLEPEARFYQRMLAMDEEELLRLSETYAQEHSLPELYDSIIVPALGLAEHDRHKGALAEMRQSFIVQNTRELIEILGEREAEAETGPSPLASQASGIGGGPVLCMPAKDDADELSALMLVQLLRKKGIASRALPAKTLPSECAKYIRRAKVSLVCISGIPPFSVTPARLACKRLKEEFPALKVVVGIWSSAAQPTELASRLGTSCPDGLVTCLREAVVRLEALLRAQKRPGPEPVAFAPAPVANGRPTATDAEPEEVFDSVTREAAKLLNVPVSLVSVIDTDRQFWASHGGLPPDMVGADVLRETAAAGSGATGDGVLDIRDVTQDSRFANDALLQERGIRFYASVPLRTKDGHVVGSLCVTDTEPHQVTDEDRARLRALGEKLIERVEQRTVEPG